MLKNSRRTLYKKAEKIESKKVEKQAKIDEKAKNQIAKEEYEKIKDQKEKFYKEHAGLRELLSSVYSKKEQEEK
mgnify:CR=1 FL=1